jgi:hypothetical protein
MLNSFIYIFDNVQSLENQPIWYSWYYVNGEKDLFNTLKEGINKYIKRYYLYI